MVLARGLVHIDEKKKKKAGGSLKLGNAPCIRETDGHVGGEQLGQVQCVPLTSESPRLHSTPYGLLVQSVFRVLPFPSPDTNEMSAVQSLNPQCLVKPLKGILTAP